MKKFAVFGHPIAHSQSPFIHQEFAGQFGIELSYERILSPLDGFRDSVSAFFAAGGCAVTMTNRTFSKAQSLAERFAGHGKVSAMPVSETGTTGFSLIINATSSGVDGAVPQIPQSLLNPSVACYDMFYRTGLTPFLQLAADNGVTRYADGLGMLAGQAAFAFRLWHGVLPDIAPVLTKLKQKMTS